MATLNETLPPYMTMEYTLAPFKPTASTNVSSGNWSSSTVLQRCGTDLDLTGLNVDYYSAAKGSGFAEDQYPVRFVPNWILLCSTDSPHTFFATIVRDRRSMRNPLSRPTAMFCSPHYFSEKVWATVDIESKTPRNIKSNGVKLELDPHIFNTAHFEQAVSNVVDLETVVTGAKMPSWKMFDLMKRLQNESLAAVDKDFGTVPPLLPMPFASKGAHFRTISTLGILHTMTEVLGGNFTTSTLVMGEVWRPLETFLLHPLFTHIVQVLLGIVSTLTLTLSLLYARTQRGEELQFDPSTIASNMPLVADNESLLERLVSLDSLN
ncbi:hypothetical protein P154DRAFT_572394 [Amniculicola lignicola CBS 123094]|uniref:Uncharacterized protein n=1 Tax=Amniculicola lignicola CBS 123094 TaxID=1392246 RepID=A0A6A5WPY2_9PLEO|nr:hypothetical protein P154DRAFT_572394 [Amniculicola lignicola CBS 123094]